MGSVIMISTLLTPQAADGMVVIAVTQPVSMGDTPVGTMDMLVPIQVGTRRIRFCHIGTHSQAMLEEQFTIHLAFESLAVKRKRQIAYQDTLLVLMIPHVAAMSKKLAKSLSYFSLQSLMWG